MEQTQIEQIKRAGKIAVEVRAFARDIIKKGVPLLQIAEQIEAKIEQLGGKAAFPVNLSKNEIAAHATPLFEDTELAEGLLKVDIGIHVDGYVADSAFSLDLENLEENKKLIQAAEKALHNALQTIHEGIEVREIGKIIEQTIQSCSFNPIRNLSGHSIEQYNLHAGMNIPNYDNGQTQKMTPGLYAVEPFTTNGAGAVRDSKPSGIYLLIKSVSLREPFAREVLKTIAQEYNTLPFCSRWLQKKYGTRVLIALKRMEESGAIRQYPLLIETAKGKVAQAEHTILVTLKNTLVTTK